MKSYNEIWIVIACNSNFIITEIITVKNIGVTININDPVSKLVTHTDTNKLLDFTLTLKNEKVSFGYELGIVDDNRLVTPMDFGGVEYENNYIITAFTNYLGLYGKLLTIDNKPINYLREKMRYFSITPAKYQELSGLNNEVINIQRELYKKNAVIVDLLSKKDEMNKQLEALNATKDRIFSIIGHDLRAPLANIIQSMNLITYDKLIYEEWKKENFFSNLSDSASSTMHLLENLLEWSKSQLGETSFYPKKFILLKSIRSSIDLLKGVAVVKRITIVEELNYSFYVYADQRMIEVILRNLLSNAIKFTKEDGQIIIAVTMDKGFAKVVLNDNGLGMPPEKTKTLFDINRNNVAIGTNGEKGTGFGLLLCKKLIEQNGGSISLWSKLGKGSEFTVTIPLKAIEVNTTRKI